MMMIKPFMKVDFKKGIGLVDVGWSKLYLCSWNINAGLSSKNLEEP